MDVDLGVVRNGDARIEEGDEYDRIWMEMRPGVALRWHCYRFQGCLVRVYLASTG